MITPEEKEELRKLAEDVMGLDKMPEEAIARLIEEHATTMSSIADYCVAKRKGMRFEVTIEDSASTFTQSARFTRVRVRTTKSL